MYPITMLSCIVFTPSDTGKLLGKGTKKNTYALLCLKMLPSKRSQIMKRDGQRPKKGQNKRAIKKVIENR